MSASSPGSSQSLQFSLSLDAVSILPEKLYLVSLPKQILDVCTKALIEITLFSKGGGVVSYTETSDEISLIVKEEELKLLPPLQEITVSSAWRAIQVFEGSDAINECGIIQFLSASLADQRMPVIYLSTYATDLIIVEQHNVQVARAQVINRLQLLNEQKKQQPLDDSVFLSTNTVEKKTSSTTSVVLSNLKCKLFLVNVKRKHLESITHPLLRVLLFGRQSSIENQQQTRVDNESFFFSITLRSDEITLIMDQRALDVFEDYAKNYFEMNKRTWNVLQVTEGSLGNQGAPIVCPLSEILAENNIDIYYLSTFNYDFILMPNDKSETAIQCLKASKSIEITDYDE